MKLWESIRYHIKDNWEIYLLTFVLSIWYFSTIGGSFSVDEVVYVNSAKSIFKGNYYVNMEHPPLGKYFIGLGIEIFGESSFGARFFSAVLGILTVFVTYRIGRLLDRRSTALLGAGLLGITHIFYSNSGHAMLDMYITFFSTVLLLLVLSVVIKGKLQTWHGIMIGLCSGFVLMSKLYGIFFAIASYVILVGFFFERVNNKKIMEIIKENKIILISISVFLLTCIIIYFPYLLEPGRSLDYMFDRNISHIEGGHSQTIAWRTYDNPPFWSYFFWIYEMGSIFIIGLFAAFFLLIHNVLKDIISKRTKVVLIYFIIPFLFFSLLSVKFPRYMLPLVPIISLLSVISLYRIIYSTLKKMGLSNVKFPVIKYPSLISIFAISSVFLLVPSPYYDLKNDTNIGVDSGYGEVTDTIRDIYDINNKTKINVLCYYAQILKYYLDEDLNKVNVTYLRYYTSSTNELKSLKENKFDLVVDYSYQSRYTNQEIYKYIRNNYKDKIEFNSGLCIYIMSDIIIA